MTRDSRSSTDSNGHANDFTDVAFFVLQVLRVDHFAGEGRDHLHHFAFQQRIGFFSCFGKFVDQRLQGIHGGNELLAYCLQRRPGILFRGLPDTPFAPGLPPEFSPPGLSFPVRSSVESFIRILFRIPAFWIPLIFSVAPGHERIRFSRTFALRTYSSRSNFWDTSAARPSEY